MRRALVILLAAGLLTGAAVAVGTLASGHDTGGDDPGSEFRTTPLSAFDPAAATVARAPFCSAIDPRQVEAALGGEPDTSRSWSNGDTVALGDGTEDVVHEFGCEYVAADGTAARAWVFAPPVEERMARRLTRTLSPTVTGAATCTGSGPAAFGDPSAVNSCLSDQGQSTAYGGLFGDTWLHCELQVPPDGADADEVADRAGRWCVGVATAEPGQ